MVERLRDHRRDGDGERGAREGDPAGRAEDPGNHRGHRGWHPACFISMKTPRARQVFRPGPANRGRRSPFAPGDVAGQESFMRVSEILALARQAGIAPGVSVLDLCCGVAGPGRLIAREVECDYLGVDLSASAIAIARERAADLPCRFEV